MKRMFFELLLACKTLHVCVSGFLPCNKFNPCFLAVVSLKKFILVPGGGWSKSTTTVSLQKIKRIFSELLLSWKTLHACFFNFLLCNKFNPCVLAVVTLKKFLLAFEFVSLHKIKFVCVEFFEIRKKSWIHIFELFKLPEINVEQHERCFKSYSTPIMQRHFLCGLPNVKWSFQTPKGKGSHLYL